MKNRRIGVVISRTVNLGNYESAKVQASIEADIPNDVDAEDLYVELWSEVQEEVGAKIKEIS